MNNETQNKEKTNNGRRDKPVPEFVPTQQDLRSLALQLVREIGDADYLFRLGCGCDAWWDMQDPQKRLDRLWNFLSKDVQTEIELAMTRAAEKAASDVAEIHANWEAEAALPEAEQKAAAEKVRAQDEAAEVNAGFIPSPDDPEIPF
jgi:hypothetical protein